MAGGEGIMREIYATAGTATNYQYDLAVYNGSNPTSSV